MTLNPPSSWCVQLRPPPPNPNRVFLAVVVQQLPLHLAAAAQPDTHCVFWFMCARRCCK